MKIVIGGAGVGGLAVGSALASAGHDVKILEVAPTPCEKESRAGQARRHGGAYFSEETNLARRTSIQSRELDSIDGLVRPCGATYFIRETMTARISAAWKAASIAFAKESALDGPLSRSARIFGLSAFRTHDGIINVKALRDFLVAQALTARALVICSNKIVGAEIIGNRIASIRVVERGIELDYPCDLWINMTGAWLREVEASVNPGAMVDTFELRANPVLLVPWPFNFEPRIIQFYGDDLFDRLAIIPLVDDADPQPISTAATTGGIPIERPDELSWLEEGSGREEERLSDLLESALPGWFLRRDRRLRWCIRSSFWEPGDPEGTRRLARVVRTEKFFGGVANSCVGSPGKLGNALALKKCALDVVGSFAEG